MTHPEEARRRDRARKDASSAREESEGTLVLVCADVVGRAMMAVASRENTVGYSGREPYILVDLNPI